ncbi:TPA: hypothetical protein JBD08_00550 [Legionella pneumophila subsp. pneumophila]|nr:hypothetical protein [Legionella pneumophila]HAT8682422.1 hypothetical protein [Legionella pneumophila subsp. pneumophila ATCC 43283]HAT8842650.1 hypothetical protein [Legionella pneumophila subsp. pneumophila]HAT6831545.1 hypothetical protein [Legionella pneumophila]HAT7786575.1 hypothetical protein [Legionella pneumophila]
MPSLELRVTWLHSISNIRHFVLEKIWFNPISCMWLSCSPMRDNRFKIDLLPKLINWFQAKALTF